MINVPRSLALLVLPVFKHSISLHLLKEICTTLWFSKVTLTLLCVVLLICYFPKSGGRKHFFESNQMKSNIFDFLDFNTNCGKLKNLRIFNHFYASKLHAHNQRCWQKSWYSQVKEKAFIPYSKDMKSFLPSCLLCPKRVCKVFLFDMELRIWDGVCYEVQSLNMLYIWTHSTSGYLFKASSQDPTPNWGDMRCWLLLGEGESSFFRCVATGRLCTTGEKSTCMNPFTALTGCSELR